MRRSARGVKLGERVRAAATLKPAGGTLSDRRLAALGARRVVHAWLYRHAGEVARVAARLIAVRDRSHAAS